MTNNPNLNEAREKALESPNIGKRGRGKKTIAREEALNKLSELFFDNFEEIVGLQIELASTGDYRAYKDLMDRIFGKPRQQVDVLSGDAQIKVIQPTIEKILINAKENQKLAELRDWLLPMLMNGQVAAE
tara:strand:+ start:689 stop:1078 length:390 start_codon:yes stop_codon:yes gene_type:complete